MFTDFLCNFGGGDALKKGLLYSEINKNWMKRISKAQYFMIIDFLDPPHVEIYVENSEFEAFFTSTDLGKVRWKIQSFLSQS